MNWILWLLVGWTLIGVPVALRLLRDAGFRDPRHVSGDDLAARYFAGRADGMRTYAGEELLVATT